MEQKLVGKKNRRRGPGEGSIYQRRDGRWTAAISIGNGKRKSFYGKSRQEVATKLTKALHTQQNGLKLPNERVTVASFMLQWLECAVRGFVRPATYTSYEGIVRLHILPEIGHLALARLSTEDIQKLLGKKQKAGLSNKRLHHILSVLKQALNTAVAWEKVPRNVAQQATAPPLKKQQIVPLTPEEARHFLAACEDDRLGALFTVALAMGLRRGEILGLQWDDVDFKSRTLSVRHALQRVEGQLQLVPPKSTRSIRTIPIPDIAMHALKRHQTRQEEEARAAGHKWTGSGFVFTTSIGTPLDGDNVTKRFKRLLREAGIRDQRFHDLRHCCGTLLVAQGVHPRVVMEILGHSQISVTMNTYASVNHDLQQNAMAKLNNVLSTDAQA